MQSCMILGGGLLVVMLRWDICTSITILWECENTIWTSWLCISGTSEIWIDQFQACLLPSSSSTTSNTKDAATVAYRTTSERDYGSLNRLTPGWWVTNVITSFPSSYRSIYCAKLLVGNVVCFLFSVFLAGFCSNFHCVNAYFIYMYNCSRYVIIFIRF